jgi:transcriptional regulator with XRE-family HTH domain
MTIFWKRFWGLCEEMNVSPCDVVTSVNMSSGTCTRWKRGIMPSSEALIKIADKLDVSTDYLLGRTDLKTVELTSVEKEIVNQVSSYSKDEQEVLIIALRILMSKGI